MKNVYNAMRVLSLFDGMSCGQIALKEIGITPEVYYASEIDKFAIKQTQLNFPRSEVIADITQAMEDCLMPYIDDLAGAIRAAVWSKGVSEEWTEAAVLSLIVSSLATTSGRLISGGYQIMKEMGGGQGGNPFTFMSIDKIRHLSTSLSDAITGGEIALEEKEANDITKASGIFRWWVEVSYVCEGIGAVTTLMFDTREEAEAVKPGYKFLC